MYNTNEPATLPPTGQYVLQEMTCSLDQTKKKNHVRLYGKVCREWNAKWQIEIAIGHATFKQLVSNWLTTPSWWYVHNIILLI